MISVCWKNELRRGLVVVLFVLQASQRACRYYIERKRRRGLAGVLDCVPSVEEEGGLRQGCFKS